MTLQPIVYVSDMARSRAFYETLGFEHRRTSRSGRWQEFQLGSAWLALHHSPGPLTPGRVELSIVVETGELEAFSKRLDETLPDVDIVVLDEAFGRSFTVHDPDGLPLSVIEQEVELYTETRS